MHEVAATEVVDRLQPKVVIAEQPMAAHEDACVGCGGDDLREAGVIGVLGVRLDLTYAVGSASGRAVNKFARHGIVARTGPVLGVPLIESGGAAWLECRLIRDR